MSGLKAYSAFDGNECTIVVFADTRGQARRRGASALDCGFTEVAAIRRTPTFDRYAPGPVPQQAYLDAGWWLYCDGCEAHVTGDDLPIVIGETAYCSTLCHERHSASSRSADPRASTPTVEGERS